MPVFFEISSLIKRLLPEIRSAMKETLSELPEKTALEYINSIYEYQESEFIANSVQKWLLFNYLTFSGFLQVIVYYASQPVYIRGAGILPWDITAERNFSSILNDSQKAILKRVHRRIGDAEPYLEIEGVVPASIAPITWAILEKEILPLLQNHYFHLPGFSDERKINLRQSTEKQCLKVIDEGLGRGKPVTLTHFKFQDMLIYFEMSGRHRTSEIINEMADIIRRNLKKNDYLIQLTPVSFLMISPGAREIQIQNRFNNIYFQVRGLILDYDLNLLTITEYPIEFAKIWETLKV